MLFADIKGLEDVKQHLIASVQNNHIAHAQLFLGKKGSANLPMALAFATYLNCLDRKEHDACGVCSSCLKTNKYIHPDLHFVFPVSPSKNVSGKEVLSASYMNDWRNFLLQQPYGDEDAWSEHFGGENKQLNISREESRNMVSSLSLKVFEGNYKIMLIWLPEYMHPTAANGILKILEEPTEKTVFLLVSCDINRMLSTILSRTQIFKIRPFYDNEIQKILTEEFQLDEIKAKEIAILAEGSLGEAFKLLAETDDSLSKNFREWMRACYTYDFTRMVSMADGYQKMSKVTQKNFLSFGLTVLREVLAFQYSEHYLNRMQGEELEFIKNFSKVMTIPKMEKLMTESNTAAYHLERNANAKIVFLDFSLIVSGILRSGGN